MFLVDNIKTLLSIVTGGSPLPSQMAAVFLLDALPSRVAEQVRLQHGEDMELRCIVSCTKALLAGAQPQNESAAAAFSKEQRSITSGGDYRRGVTKESGGAARSVRCFGCDRPGHVKRDCTVVCFRCHEKGHIRRNCQASVPERPGNEREEAALPDHAAPAKEF